MGGVRAIFFDAGNTLVHLDYAFIAGTFREYGIPLSPEQVRHGEQRARVPIDRIIAGIGGAERHEPDIMRAYFRFALEFLGLPVTPEAERALAPVVARTRAGRLWTVVEPGTAELLADLGRRGYLLAVVSNSNGTIEGYLEEVGLRRHFAFVIDSFVVGVEKPDPRIFRLALERAGVEATDATYIGDLYHIDVRGAESAGLNAILLDPGGAWEDVACRKAPDLRAAVASILGAEPAA
ncbi:MAG TPA: HAD-IA family hydrolase [Candidatus Sulfotelmatobacter sp.]|nr:HAD-IA family hydrolase [Candidatus Sulfotelmatobacter sp.]